MMLDRLEELCLNAALSGTKVWTDREVEIEDGELVRTYLNEYLTYFGTENGGEVERRWVLTTHLKNSGKIISTQRMIDLDLDQYFPETDIELPDPPEGVGKSRDELYLKAKKEGVL
jgi:hypothetical protein